MTTYEFPSTEFACLVDYSAMTEDVLLRDDAKGINNFCNEHKDAVIMCCLDADRIPTIPVDDNIPDDSYWYNFLFNKETDTEVDFYNPHAEFNYYPFKIVSSMSTPIGLLEIEEDIVIDESLVLKTHQLTDMYGNLYYTRIVTFDRLLNYDECFEYKKHGYLPAQDRHPVEFYRCD